MLFILIAVFAVLGIVFRQSHLRFREAAAAEGKSSEALTGKAYSSWLRRRTGAIFKKETIKKTLNIFGNWTTGHYPGWTKWIFIGLTASFLYLAASGFFFALFIPRGMFGVPLLAHVGFGGLFAVSLAAAMIWRARAYRWDEPEAAAHEGFASPIFKKLSKTSLRKILFWAFAVFGLVQIVTTLGTMLPVFTFETQQVMSTIHRYSALAIILTAIVFIDITFISQRRS